MSQNRNLLLGAAAALALWLIVYFAFVRSNWSACAAKLKESEATRADWEKYYQPKAGLLPKTDAERALEENGNQLSANLQTLQKTEMGTAQWLYPFTVAAAKGDDPNNYFDRKRIEIVNKANNEQHVPVPPGLGIIGERGGEDPVAVKLLRLYMAHTFIDACHKAGVKRILPGGIKHYPPRLIYVDGEDEEEGAAAAGPAKKGEPAKTAAPAGASRVVQFPMKVTIQAPETSIGKVLFELQQPSDKDHGCLVLRGFSVAAKDPGSGLVEATVAVAGLLSESYTQEQGIVMKGAEDRPGPGRKVDLKGW